MSLAYILRSQDRAAYDPAFAQYAPDSVAAWSVEPDESIAPVGAWEEVQDLEAALASAPAMQIPPEPQAPQEPAPQDPAVLVKQRILAAMEFGKQLMAEYGAQNVLAGKSTAEIAAISDKLSVVQARLLSGSLYATIAAIDELQVDALVSQQSADAFKLQIQQFLGIAPAPEPTP